MHPYLRPKIIVMRACILILLLTFLVGCGTAGSGPDKSSGGKLGRTSTPQSTTAPTPSAVTMPSPTPNPTPSPTPIPTTVPTSTPSLASFLHNTPVSADIHGLHLYSVEGLQCPLRRRPLAPNQQSVLTGPSDDLVLVTERLTYSQDEIQQMRNYINAIYNNTASITTSYQRTPPSTLQWVPAGLGCGLTLQVSNTGTTTVQISSLGVRLTSAPRPNNYQYHVVDICSLVYIDSACNGLSIAGDCSAYVTSVILKPSITSNAVVAATPQQGANEAGPCPEPTLHPGETLYFNLKLSSEGSQQSSIAPYIYSVVPLLTVNDGNTEKTSELPSMAATIAFSPQMPCYGLPHEQDTTFTLVTFRSRGCLG